MFPIDPEPTPPPKDEKPRYRDPPPASGAGRSVPWTSRFEELTVSLRQEVVEFTHVRSNPLAQNVALAISTFIFVIFVVSIMPLMGLSTAGNAIWIVIGLVLLGVVGLAMQARVRTTRLRLDRFGLTLERGTPTDMESIQILWTELEGVDLEPVNEKDGRKGMRLRLRLRGGEHVDTLDGVALGELNDVRRVIGETVSRHRLDAPR